MKTALIIAATFTIALATGVLVAQTSATPPAGSNPPLTAPPTPMPPSSVPTSPRSNTAPMGRPGMPTTMQPDFNTLDTGHVGYITQQQASTDPWLSRNFTTCDTNHDGQVSRGEYAVCTHQP